MKEAELEIIRQLQSFVEERKTLIKKQNVNSDLDGTSKIVLKKGSSLYKLDPIIDDNKIMRVGGRIRRANIDQDMKQSYYQRDLMSLTQICHYHKVLYQVTGITLNEIRSSEFCTQKGKGLCPATEHE